MIRVRIPPWVWVRVGIWVRFWVRVARVRIQYRVLLRLGVRVRVY